MMLQSPYEFDIRKKLSFISELIEKISQKHELLSLPTLEMTTSKQLRVEQLGENQMNRFIQRLNDHHAFISAIIENDIPFKDGVKSCQFALNYFKFKCDPDFIKNLDHNDLVEIYSLEMVQLFRNFRFFEICGYSLIELETFAWQDLYDRSEKINQKMIEYVHLALSGRNNVDLHSFDSHYMKEKFSSTKQVVKIKFKNIAPVFDDQDQCCGFIVSQNAELVLEDDHSDSVLFI